MQRGLGNDWSIRSSVCSLKRSAVFCGRFFILYRRKISFRFLNGLQYETQFQKNILTYNTTRCNIKMLQPVEQKVTSLLFHSIDRIEVVLIVNTNCSVIFFALGGPPIYEVEWIEIYFTVQDGTERPQQ